jgi:hypothetical protein
MMNRAPTTEKTEETLSAISTVLAWSGVKAVAMIRVVMLGRLEPSGHRGALEWRETIQHSRDTNRALEVSRSQEG